MAAVEETVKVTSEVLATKTAGKVKKVVAKKARSAPAHPPYIEMISQALTTLKEKNGSSQYAIQKYIEENQKNIPSNFRKLLLVNLRKFVASGRLVKIKGSYKIPSAKKAAVDAKPKAVKAAVKPKKAVTTAAKPKKAVKPKSKAVEKAKAAPVKAAGTKRKAVAAVKPAKVAKTAAKSGPSSKKAAPVAKKAAPAAKKVVKKAVVKTVKPKSVKSPAKRAQSKRGKK